MNKGSELIDILLKKHNLEYDDLHDVRTLVDILADMVPTFENGKEVSETYVKCIKFTIKDLESKLSTEELGPYKRST